MRQRLQVVWEYISNYLNQFPPGKIAVIGVCAGDSRDLIGTFLITAALRMSTGDWWKLEEVLLSLQG